jgi:hypothetical protein
MNVNIKVRGNTAAANAPVSRAIVFDDEIIMNARRTTHDARRTTHDARRTTHDARRTTHDARRIENSLRYLSLTKRIFGPRRPYSFSLFSAKNPQVVVTAKSAAAWQSMGGSVTRTSGLSRAYGPRNDEILASCRIVAGPLYGLYGEKVPQGVQSCSAKRRIWAVHFPPSLSGPVDNHRHCARSSIWLMNDRASHALAICLTRDSLPSTTSSALRGLFFVFSFFPRFAAHPIRAHPARPR